MYHAIADAAIPKYQECVDRMNCKAVNCPFEKFPDSYGIKCIHIHELELYDPITDDRLPDYTSDTLFFNFGFEGDGSTSAINGINSPFYS